MKEPTIRELEDELEIDETNLEEMCRHQPTLYYQVSKQLAMCISQRDAAKQTLAEVEAEEDTRFRRQAVKNEEKVTEPQLKSRVKASGTVVKAMEYFLAFGQRVGELQALKEAFQQRSYALSHLVDLHINAYYGEASTNRTTTTMRDAKANSARRQLSERRLSKED